MKSEEKYHVVTYVWNLKINERTHRNRLNHREQPDVARGEGRGEGMGKTADKDKEVQISSCITSHGGTSTA